MIETDKWPIVPAKWFTDMADKPARRVRVVVIHDMEYPESDKAAEDIARYFATTNTKASAHVCIDNDSVVQCVRDRDIAYAAPGCNSDGIQLELAGYASQAAQQWDDFYSRALLNNAANVCAQYCAKYDIPPVHLTNAELNAGRRGIVGHYQVSQVYQKSDHQDPGPSFPWQTFMAQVAAFHRARCLRLAR